MSNHSWRSHLTPEESRDLVATEAYHRWAMREAQAAAFKIAQIRNRCVKRKAAEEKKEIAA